MRTTRPQPSTTFAVVAALTGASVAACFWVAVTVSVGVALVGLVGVAAALWLVALSTMEAREPIPVAVEHRRSRSIR
jgi:hypothetical protein